MANQFLKYQKKYYETYVSISKPTFSKNCIFFDLDLIWSQTAD